MLVIGALDAAVDSKPIAYHHDVTERHAGLGHPEIAGVHAGDEDLVAAASESAQIFAVRGPRVLERIVDMTYGGAEPHRSEVVEQPLGDCNQRGSHSRDPR